MTELERTHPADPQDPNLLMQAESFVEAMDHLEEVSTRLHFAAFNHTNVVEPYTDRWFGQFYPEALRSYASMGKETVRAVGILAVVAPVAFIKRRQIGKVIGKENVTLSTVRDILHNA
jgi:hypothetical protein